MTITIRMPALMASMTEGKLVRWLKKEGELIGKGEILAEIETDKALMEMEAPHAGRLDKILVQEGQEAIAVDEPIAVLLDEIASAGPAQADGIKQPEASATAADARVAASPVARRMAQAAGLDLRSLAASGPDGRVVKIDVERAASAAPTLAQVETTAAGRACRSVPNSSIRKTIARRLTEAKATIPHFYLTIDCVLDELLALRQAVNADSGESGKVSVNDFIVRACALALREVPHVNASWTEDAVRVYEDVDVCVAVATTDGLMTPVIRNADRKSVAEISVEMRELAARAKQRRLKPHELQGGGFSISNLGMYGSRQFDAIINPPQAAILAVGKADPRVIVKEGKIASASLMTCTLSCDHRVIDGATGAEFLASFRGLVESSPRTLL